MWASRSQSAVVIIELYILVSSANTPNTVVNVVLPLPDTTPNIVVYVVLPLPDTILNSVVNVVLPLPDTTRNTQLLTWFNQDRISLLIHS